MSKKNSSVVAAVLVLAISFMVTSGLIFIALIGVHSLGILLSVKWSWVLSFGIWIIWMIFKGLRK